MQQLRTRPVVYSILLISCLPFILLKQQGLASIALWFIPADLAQLQQVEFIWRLWSPMFIHYTLLHLLSNGYLWWALASKLEAVSRSQLVTLVLLAAPLSNLCQWWFSGPKFGGLSGVVYAVFGYCLVMSYLGRDTRFGLDRGLVLVLLAMIPIAATGAFGQFANAAHVSGLLLGLLIGATQLLASGRPAA